MNKQNISTIAEKIIQFCIATNKRFIFISGNGGSGKTELGKLILKKAARYGHINFLEMDDFVVDTSLRNSAIASWNDIQNKKQTGRYTTSFRESYFLQNIKAIIYNIKKENNYYHWPKKAQTSKECRLLFGNAKLTIIEGVGTVFLKKNKSDSISIFLQCKKKLEIERRVKRARTDNEKSIKEVNKHFNERNSQYKSIIQPYIKNYDCVFESNKDFSINILRDDFNIFS